MQKPLRLLEVLHDLLAHICENQTIIPSVERYNTHSICWDQILFVLIMTKSRNGFNPLLNGCLYFSLLLLKYSCCKWIVFSLGIVKALWVCCWFLLISMIKNRRNSFFLSLPIWLTIIMNFFVTCGVELNRYFKCQYICM